MEDVRPYDPEFKEQAHRIWREVGWISEDNLEPLSLLLEEGNVQMGLLRGSAESLAITVPGSFRYLSHELPMTVVAAVTTSLVARRHGLAGRTTARAIQAGAEAGNLVTALGVFDQGYYDRLGFATMPYTHKLAFDPAQLVTRRIGRAPHRFDQSHSTLIHESRLRRHRGHGSVNILSEAHTRSEMLERKDAKGLGFYNNRGEISHHLWGRIAGEHGPFDVWWSSYETLDQLKELLALLHSLSDQIHLVRMIEPKGVVLQDFLETPFKYRRSTAKGEFEQNIVTAAASQLRVLDIPRAMEVLSLAGEGSIECNLTIEDPIEKKLPKGSGWNGCGGSYVATFGPRSSATRGRKEGLPELKMGVGAFSQLWCGARTIDHLRLIGGIQGEEKLLSELEKLVYLPRPDFEWLF